MSLFFLPRLCFLLAISAAVEADIAKLLSSFVVLVKSQATSNNLQNVVNMKHGLGLTVSKLTDTFKQTWSGVVSHVKSVCFPVNLLTICCISSSLRTSLNQK